LPNQTSAELARTQNCGAVGSIAVERLAVRTVKRPEPVLVRGVLQLTGAQHRRVAGIDVHRMLHAVTVLIERPDGSIAKHGREFGGFRRDCRTLAAWLAEMQVELLVMESTGIYWKSLFSHLENAGVTARVVNAPFIKHVPGRKTDMLDSEWLAVLARFGLVRGSFIPRNDLRELRLVARYRRKLSPMCSSQINRMHKMLDDAGIKRGAVVADIHGVSARAMVRGLIEGQSQVMLLSHARGSLKRKTEDLAASLDSDLSERHLFVLRHLSESIEALQRQLTDIDAYLMRAMRPYARVYNLLRTISSSEIELATLKNPLTISSALIAYACRISTS
jgi:transposase